VPVLALGGGTAVALNGSNTVQSDDLGPGAQVKATDVAANAINGADVVNNGLTGNDIRNQSLGTAEFSRSIPTVHVTNSGNQTSPHLTPTDLAFDSERGDSAGMHSNTTNNSRLTAPVSGIYRVSAQIVWGFSSTGVRDLGLYRNGSTLIATDHAIASTANQAVTQEVSTERGLVAGDYVEATVVQNSGGSLDVRQANDYSAHMTMTWLAPGR